jgi:hypothetical protein
VWTFVWTERKSEASAHSKSLKSLVDVAGIEPATPSLQSTRLDSTDSIHRYQLLTFPTNLWGICFSLQANPNRTKTLDCAQFVHSRRTWG